MRSLPDPISAKAVQALLADAAPELDLAFRPMFGGIMGYAGGKPFASLSNVGLAFKFAGPEHEERLRVPGALPLRYEPESAPSRSYVLVPRAVLDDPVQLAEWARASAARLKPQPEAKPKRKR